jgi:hypothetical protein
VRRYMPLMVSRYYNELGRLLWQATVSQLVVLPRHNGTIGNSTWIEIALALRARVGVLVWTPQEALIPVQDSGLFCCYVPAELQGSPDHRHTFAAFTWQPSALPPPDVTAPPPGTPSWVTARGGAPPLARRMRREGVAPPGLPRPARWMAEYIKGDQRRPLAS